MSLSGERASWPRLLALVNHLVFNNGNNDITIVATLAVAVTAMTVTTEGAFTLPIAQVNGLRDSLTY